jgi:hypothetical protein
MVEPLRHGRAVESGWVIRTCHTAP